MRILIAAAAALFMLGGASANAQSLEQTYAELCSDPAKAKSESCVALAQALVAKLQGGATSTNSPTPQGPGAATLADKRVAPPPAASPQLTMEQRWGLYLGLVDKKLIDVLVGGNVPYEFPPAIVTFAWDVPGQVMGMFHVQLDGSTTKIATLRWDEERGGLVETSLPDGAEGLLLVPQADRSYVAFTPSGSRITQRKVENDAIEMRTESTLGNRWDLGWLLHRVPFTPESFDLMKQIHANSQNGARLSASMDPKYRDPEYLRMMAERAAAARAAKAERSAGRAAMFGAVMQGVAQGVAEIDTGGYAEAQANLDATVANIEYAAAAERQQQNSSQQAGQQPARASQPQMQVAPSSSPSPSTASHFVAGQAVASPSAGHGESGTFPGKQLRFVLTISMRNLPGDKVNSTCYSNVVTRDGPPGWGSPGFLPRGSAEQAREIVYSLKSAFIAQCRASGREITSDGNFNFQLNQSQGDEERLQGMRPRYGEDVSVSL